MMKRLKLALRILFGLPLRGVRIDESYLLDQDEASELDYTKTAPFDLAFGGIVKDAPPEMTFEEERFRVTLFPEKDDQVKFNDRHFRWLVLELRGDKKWHHLVTMTETRIGIIFRVLGEAKDFLDYLTEQAEEERLHRAVSAASAQAMHAQD